MRKFGVNTVVYLWEMIRGKSQAELLSHIHNCGGQIAEVRREFIKENECSAISGEAERLGLTVYYSVPEPIFKENQLNQHMLDAVMKEAAQLKAVCVKFSLGDFRNVPDEELERFCNYEKQCGRQILIENGPKGAEGDADLLADFFRRQESYGGHTALTFDTGNFATAGFDPMECASRFAAKTRWIHLKNVKGKGDAAKITMLEEGDIDFEAVLAVFNREIPVAIEYPCESYSRAASEMNKAQALLKRI